MAAVTYLPEFRRIASYIRTLGAFIVGGFVSKAVNAWYLRRKNYVSFCGNGRNTILNLATVVVAKPGASKEDKERMTIARRTLARWVMLGRPFPATFLQNSSSIQRHRSTSAGAGGSSSSASCPS